MQQNMKTKVETRNSAKEGLAEPRPQNDEYDPYMIIILNQL